MADSGHWAGALRVIGQELAKYRAAFVEIEVRQDDFVVRLSGAANAGDSPAHHTKQEFKASGRIKIPRSKPEARRELDSCEIRFSPEDISRLNEQWAAKRGSGYKNPDLYNLPELLRTAGRYLDSKGYLLKKLVKNPRTIVLQFRDQDGELNTREASVLELYRLQQDLIAKRGTTDINDLWRRRDW